MNTTPQQSGFAFLADISKTVTKKSWTRVDGGSCKTSAVYLHAPTGSELRHCGHPTALRPFYFLAGDGVAPNNEKFKNTKIAFASLGLSLTFTEVE
jgi:hypothetical protein